MAKESVIEKMKHKMQPPPPKEVSISEATESMRKVLEKQVSEETMRKERYEHSVRVAAECKRLAQIYHVNEDLAEFAGMVHDICKDMKADDQKALMEAGKDDLDITEEEWNTKKLWHGIAGAQLMRQQSACIGCHSVSYGCKKRHDAIGADCLSGRYDRGRTELY